MEEGWERNCRGLEEVGRGWERVEEGWEMVEEGWERVGEGWERVGEGWGAQSSAAPGRGSCEPVVIWGGERADHQHDWAPLPHKRRPPQPAQPRHTSHWAPRARKRHQQEHRPQRPTEHSDPTQHAKGRTGDCPGPCKETATRRNTQGGQENRLEGPDGFFPH